MNDFWILCAVLIACAFGTLDGLLDRLKIKRWAACGLLAGILVLSAILPPTPYADALTLAMLVLCPVFFGAFPKERAAVFAAFGLSAGMTLLLRLLIPIENGQLFFSQAWLWAPVAVAAAMAVTVNLRAATVGAVAGLAVSELAYVWIIGLWRHRMEPLYLTGGVQMVVCMMALMAVMMLLARFYRWMKPRPDRAMDSTGQ